MRGLLLREIALVQQGSLEAPAQVSGLLCQKLRPLIAGVSRCEQAAAKDRMGHQRVVSSSWALGLQLL